MNDVPPPHPLAGIGKAIIDHVNSGATDDAPLWDAHFHPDFVSIEGDGRRYEGRDAVQKKCDDWMNAHTMHGFTADGPYLGTDSIAVRYTIDVEPNDGSWPRMTMTETAVYTIRDGKVVQEEFMYQPF
ncbi:MAG: nuclear transport factor 2 family protein [Planctomycetota bacterium]